MSKLDPVQKRLVELRADPIDGLAQRLQIELGPRSALAAPPTVLMLGNHSSGKSSMINHLLGRTIQRTGVAPTDDGFTFIMYSEDERNIDGQTLTNSADLPFEDLKRFGPSLVHHCYGRMLSVPLLQNVRLIDSPGMIDAAGEQADRPYDFLQVVRWMAERCDLVLLFFDPEKPGTTGETLHVLTQALHGIGDKLHIVMNKMDLFDGLRDFARTYGALCWNLSRNLPTKDMPHIYTTIIPEIARSESAMPLDDFSAALVELEQFIKELPQRRIDTTVNKVTEECNHLLLRARMIKYIRDRIRAGQVKVLLATVALMAVGCGLGVYWWRSDAGWMHWAGAFAASAAVLALGLGARKWVGNWIRRKKTSDLDAVFKVVYHRELEQPAQADDLHYLWQTHKPGFERALRAYGLEGIKGLRPSQIRKLERILAEDLPKLRK